MVLGILFNFKYVGLASDLRFGRFESLHLDDLCNTSIKTEVFTKSSKIFSL